jgi:2-polyprenyl-3-methyl-5-hydroxy-6-metoxy-1,4-benzoquinol methylase
MQDNRSLIFDHEESIRWGKSYDMFLRGWLPANKNDTILDVGCGSGKLLQFLLAKGFINLHGVDISPEQTALARQVCKNITEANLLNFLETTNNKYDLITALDVIEHLDKEEILRFLNSCYTALKGSGRLIVQTPNADSLWGMSIKYGDFTHEIAFSPHSLKRLMLLVGFGAIIYRETGPVIHGPFSLFRYLLWKVIRSCLIMWNLAETGNKGSGIYTRVFLITGKKVG